MPLNTSSSNTELLESWSYTETEWNQYISTSKNLKKEDNIYMGIAILIIGIPVLMLSRDTGFFIACAFDHSFCYTDSMVKDKVFKPLSTFNNK